ncbi:MAG: GyrI-like domain-containing protein [Pseudomonadota bacterium]
MTEKNLKTRLKELYLPPDDEFVIVDVPDVQFAMIDGEGDPRGEGYMHALKWLWTAVYPVRAEGKRRMGKDFVEPPLEALWWSNSALIFPEASKSDWRWRLMIVMPDWLDDDIFAEAVGEASKKLGDAPAGLRLERLHEGKSVQIMHIGPYDGQSQTIARLYSEFLPQNNFTANGHHHQIYLNDPMRTAPEKLKTVLRQPVRSLG